MEGIVCPVCCKELEIPYGNMDILGFCEECNTVWSKVFWNVEASKSYRSVFSNGFNACLKNEPKLSPYNFSRGRSSQFNNAWVRGYEALSRYRQVCSEQHLLLLKHINAKRQIG